MRIGILTFHNSRNFGANLQTLATQEMLRKLGHQPVVINYADENKLKAFDKLVIPEQVAIHENFSNNYYVLSPKLTTINQVSEYCQEELDGVLVGSDAVFRLATPYQPKRLIKRFLGQQNPYESFSWCDQVPPFFLPFEAPRLVKGSIAASSRGTSFYFLKPRMMSAVGNSLKRFDFVSVRDDWTGKLVRWLTLGSVRPYYCPDPVFALNSAFTIPDHERPDRDLSNTILLTGPFDRTWLKGMVNSIHSHGFQAAILANPEEIFGSEQVDFVLGLPMSPLRWYSSLASCAGFIGMRFHAYVTCLANNTPVVTMDVAKPFFGKFDPRNPNYDLARRADISANYFLHRDLMQTRPVEVLARLFAPQTHLKASAFAAKAPEILYGHLSRLKAASTNNV